MKLTLSTFLSFLTISIVSISANADSVDTNTAAEVVDVNPVEVGDLTADANEVADGDGSIDITIPGQGTENQISDMPSDLTQLDKDGQLDSDIVIPGQGTENQISDMPSDLTQLDKDGQLDSDIVIPDQNFGTDDQIIDDQIIKEPSSPSDQAGQWSQNAILPDGNTSSLINNLNSNANRLENPNDSMTGDYIDIDNQIDSQDLESDDDDQDAAIKSNEDDKREENTIFDRSLKQSTSQVEFAVGNVKRGSDQTMADKVKSWNGAGVIAAIGLTTAACFTIFVSVRVFLSKYF